MKLQILSPEKTLYQGPADLVALPGLLGAFTILENHAPIISGLGKGVLRYRNEGQEVSLPVEGGGFVEAKNNEVIVCIE
jgi:F-type H+-transporting ATPase subunit epsilon